MTSTGSAQPTRVVSRDNPLVKQLRQLASHNSAYRTLGQVWIEGDHLCGAAVARGVVPAVVVYAESFAATAPASWGQAAPRTVLLPDALFDAISGLGSAGRVGFVVDLPPDQRPRDGVASVILDRVQDTGNVGSILRSAAAFGFQQVLSLKGSAALWSSKVLRAGMGAHFALHLAEGLEVADVLALEVPLVVTSSHQGALLQHQALPWPCSWAFGHEGQGLGEALMARAALAIRITQPGGEESLNVAAAAAICLHASATAASFRAASRP